MWTVIGRHCLHTVGLEPVHAKKPGAWMSAGFSRARSLGPGDHLSCTLRSADCLGQEGAWVFALLDYVFLCKVSDTLTWYPMNTSNLSLKTFSHRNMTSKCLNLAAPTPKVGVLTYYFAIFLPKTAWKWKNLDPEGSVSSAPLDRWTRTRILIRVWLCGPKMGTVVIGDLDWNPSPCIGNSFCTVQSKSESGPVM